MATTPASIRKHPIHPMLIIFPIGLWISSLVCDLAYLALGTPIWPTVAFYAMVGGLTGALAAAVPGLIDLLSLPPREVKKIAVTHMSINLLVVLLYAVNIWIRSKTPADMAGPITLSAVGVALLCVSGWLGAEMVHVHGIGVDTESPARATPTTAAKAETPRRLD